MFLHDWSLDISVLCREMEHARQPIKCGVLSNNDNNAYYGNGNDVSIFLIFALCFNVSFL